MKNSAYRNCFALVSVVFVGMLGSLFPLLSAAGVYNSSTEVTYKEYWVSHNEFDGGCGVDLKTPPVFYIEPSTGCTKTLNLNIPDDFSGAIKAEIYIDLWRNRVSPSAAFSLNGNPAVSPNVGSDWSRTPYVADITMSELVTGNNTITFTGTNPYHVHDVAIRIYYDGANPLVGSDVTAPTGMLTGVGGIDPAVGGVLNVDSNSLTLTATANDDQSVAYVEFHGYYYGYDEDNDGEFIDWHNLKRNTFNPGDTGTIDHIGTDTSSPYSVTWNLPHITNQSGVKFKVRIVDNAGNVREAAGGVSADFTLSRSQLVESQVAYKFADDVLHHDADNDGFADPGFSDTITRNVILPNDLSDVTGAYLVGAYWNNPTIDLNGNATFKAFNTGAGEDTWALSVRQLNVSHLVGGDNTITYTHVGGGFGEFIEKPGPMIVLVYGTRSPAPATGFTTDEFNSGSLDTSLWSFIDPLGDSSQANTATQAQLTVPVGVAHDLWDDANHAPRILQPAADSNFEIEVKFDSIVDTITQMQGIIVQQDENEFIRFGLFTNDGTNTKLFAASFKDGVPTIQNTAVNVAAAGTSPLWMRVKREGNGDTWVQSLSTDGVNFTPNSFTYTMPVHSVGVYAGNAGTNPAHTGTFDYFRNNAVAITTQPADQTVNAGQTATFSVVASGAATITYQWQKDGVDIGGATSASYTTPATTGADDGSTYQVVVNNGVNLPVTSSAATLTVNVPPTVTTDPADITVNQGDTATFTVVASGTAPFTYQWQKDGVDIGGATSASYTTPATTGADDGTTYQVVVTNVAGNVTSAAATLTVNPAPTITTDPADITVAVGATATFSVVATATGTISYQWQKDGVDIGGATSASYTTPATTGADDGSAYQVVVTSTLNSVANSVTSAAATLTVNVAPSITTDPANQTVNEGSTATFTVVASGSGTLSYQWQKDGVDIGGATSASYTTPATTPADDGTSYQVVVTNTLNSTTTSTTSAAATLSVNLAPTIATQPADQSVVEGATATFTVVANGAAPLSYQWQKGGVDIGGATSASYTTPATVLGDSGSTYQVVVTNAVNTVTSNAATLTVTPAPVAVSITTDPADQTVNEGATATFSVVASGTAPFSYQWQVDTGSGFADIAGATAASYTTAATTPADDGNSYRVIVDNVVNSPATSAAATLTVTLAPVISTPPADQTVAAGATATFSVVAGGAAPLSYQWQKDNLDIGGATSASYTTPATTAADDGSTYQVVVTNSVGSVTSSAATLTIDSNGDGLSDGDAIALGLDPNAAGGDSDGDGTNDVTEIGGDVNNPLDSDADGVIDALEPGADSADASIASGLPLTGGGTVSITSSGQVLSAVSAAGDGSGAPAGVNFPYGTLSYTTSVTNPGDSVTVRVVFSSDLPASIELYKVDGAGAYTLMPTTIWTQVDARTVDITLTDGDPLTDLDGAADGSIEDPVAIANTTPPPAPASSGGGGGGCQLAATADRDPTLPLLLLMSLGYLFRRRRSRVSSQVQGV